MTGFVRQRALLVECGKFVAFAAAILGATILTLNFAPLTGASTAAFSFLILVLLAAFFGDLPVAIATSFVAALCYDYFFLPPFGSFTIYAFSDWISLAAFLLASVIISRLTASAADHAARVGVLSKAMAQLKEFGEWQLSQPNGRLTLTGMAGEALRVFSLDYCSIHVYGGGTWRHFTGSAASGVTPEIETRLKYLQDHPTEVMELAEESLLGVRYVPINKGAERLAVLAVKSHTLPTDVLRTLACMIGVQVNTKDPLAVEPGAGRGEQGLLKRVHACKG